MSDKEKKEKEELKEPCQCNYLKSQLEDLNQKYDQDMRGSTEYVLILTGENKGLELQVEGLQIQLQAKNNIIIRLRKFLDKHQDTIKLAEIKPEGLPC